MSRNKKYSSELISFIRENVAGRTSSELADMVSDRFGVDMTAQKIKSIKSNYGLKSGTPRGNRSGQGSDVFPKDISDFIFANYKGTGHQKMTDLLYEKFGARYTKQQIKSFYGNRKLNSGLTGRFQKGHVSHNKGKHIQTKGRMAETQFKKGNLPPNTKPIGYERITDDGYVEVKVRMRPSHPYCNDNFVMKHYLVWEQAYGAVPEGHKLMFLDGNKQNCELENLQLVSDRELLVLNRKKLLTKNAQLNKTALLVAKLNISTNDRKKG